jgi:nicotinate dehydrogenase subunit B
MRGRGFAYASIAEQEQAQPLQTWSAWVADVEYDRASGELSVTRVVAGHDLQPGTGAEAQPPAAPASRALLDEQARQAMAQLVAPAQGFDAWARADPALPAHAATPRHLATVDLVAGASVQVAGGQLGEVQLQAGGAFTLPAAAAVANAIYDATGVRLRSAPFSGEQIALALEARDGRPRPWGRFRKAGWIGAAAAALGTAFTLAMPWRPAIAPVPKPDPNLYSAATIERGRLVALAGDCMVCHTAPGGTPNAGGHALDTPFGTIYTTNITPDEKTGIGNWSYAAFERAMREGVHRDGRNLYPAFPYTAYAKMSEADMQSLYAYLMAQPAVESKTPPNTLNFPFNLRPLLSGWKLLFHKPEVFQPEPNRTALWNRGAYLVEGAGHCAACHSPRNMLGAEKKGLYHLAGGVVDGWEAPALTAGSKAPIPWTEDELFTYLRTGFSARHGTAAGPMAPVVAELAQLPAGDVRAMAHYLASLNEPATAQTAPAPVASAVSIAEKVQTVNASGKRLFQGACAACHQEGTGPTLFGVRPSLKVNTNVHSDNPDNLVNVILHGIREPANPDLGYMPGFADSFSDAQVADLLAYMRSAFAPDKPAWEGLEAQVARGRERKAH